MFISLIVSSVNLLLIRKKMKFSLVVLSLFISPEVFARPMARNRNVGKLRTPRSPRRNSRVMGGKDADIKDYPYAISLRKAEKNGNFKHNCGGSLVRKNYYIFFMNTVDKYVNQFHWKYRIIHMNFR